jgi:hypothetical protein
MTSIFDPRLNAACLTFHHKMPQRELLYLASKADVKPTARAFACQIGPLNTPEHLKSEDQKNRLVVNKHATCGDEIRLVEQAALELNHVPGVRRQALMRTDFSEESRL